MTRPAEAHEVIEIFEGVENAVGKGVQFMANARKGMDLCYDSAGPSIVTELPAYRDGYLEVKRRGGRIRVITEITKSNLPYCKKLLELVDELRHMDSVKGGLAVSEGEYMATVAALREAEPLTLVLYSNAKTIVDHQQYIFDILWKNAIPADKKIREIEEGREPEFLDVIVDSGKVAGTLLELTQTLEKDCLLILPNSAAVVMCDSLGIFNRIIKAANNRNCGVQIIFPLGKEKEIEEKIRNESPGIKIAEAVGSPSFLLIADGKKFIMTEFKESKTAFAPYEMGYSIFSNSRESVQMCTALFHSIWKQGQINEELSRIAKAKDEFIRIASHELRNPIHPILGFAELAKKGIVSNEEAWTNVLKEAHRLMEMANDILDVTRIESGGLEFTMEEVNINNVILEEVNSATAELKDGVSIRLILDERGRNTWIRAGKLRIAQVLTNVIDNAIKFTEKGEIVVETHFHMDRNKVEIIVSDTGSGIAKDVLPHLFDKFISRNITNENKHGAGLGLYISKAIIAAHRGRISASNKKEGGAKLTIELPIDASKQMT